MGDARTVDERRSGGLYSAHPCSRFGYYVAGWSAIFALDGGALRRQLYQGFWATAADRFADMLVGFGVTVDRADPRFIESVVTWSDAEWRGEQPKLNALAANFADLDRRPHRAIIRHLCERHRRSEPGASENAVCEWVANWLNDGIPHRDAADWDLSDDHVRRGWRGMADRANAAGTIKHDVIRRRIVETHNGKRAEAHPIDWTPAELLSRINQCFAGDAAIDEDEPVAVAAIILTALVDAPMAALIHLEAKAADDPRFEGVIGESLIARIDDVAPKGFLGAVEKVLVPDVCASIQEFGGLARTRRGSTDQRTNEKDD